MAHPTGESKDGGLKLDFDRRLMLQFRGSVVTSDAGLLAYRELDDALGLSAVTGETLADARTGKNGRHCTIVQRAPQHDQSLDAGTRELRPPALQRLADRGTLRARFVSASKRVTPSLSHATLPWGRRARGLRPRT